MGDREEKERVRVCRDCDCKYEGKEVEVEERRVSSEDAMAGSRLKYQALFNFFDFYFWSWSPKLGCKVKLRPRWKAGGSDA